MPSTQESDFHALLVSALLYGVHSVLISCAIPILWRKDSISRTTKVGLLAAMLSIFVLSTTLLALRMVFIRDKLGILPTLAIDTEAGVETNDLLFSTTDVLLFYFSVVIADCVVVWRACTLWTGNRKIVCVLSLLLLTTATANISFLGCRLGTGSNEISPKCGPMVLLSYISSGVTNLAATGSLGYKTWRHRKAIKKYLSSGHPTLQERVLYLVVETGAIYSLLWFLGLIDFILPDERTFAEAAISCNLLAAGAQLVGIYPSLLIVVVYLRKSYWDSNGASIPDEVILLNDPAKWARREPSEVCMHHIDGNGTGDIYTTQK
uniref:Uncharacterized protein n=1 Tax=Moniliophthora roreri TaxID=221103 RepID=A0A0W0FYV9_MONRR